MPACNVLNQKDPDVIVTTEPMLTKSEEGEVDTVVSADGINLDYNEEKGYTLGNNIIYFDYDKYSVEKNEDKDIIKKYSICKKIMKQHLLESRATLTKSSRAYNLALGEKEPKPQKELMLVLNIKLIQSQRL